MKTKYFLFLLFFGVSFAATAQVEVKISTIKEQYNGENYFIHEVQQGQTVYSIAKAYNIDINEVYKVNPFAKEAIKTGQFLKIPVNKTDLMPYKENIPENPQDKIHEPEKKEGDLIFLFTYKIVKSTEIKSLCQEFDLQKEDLFYFNPDLSKKTGILTNETILIPIKSHQIITQYLQNGKESEGVLLEKHLVQKGETLFSISKSHNCSIEDIKKYNPNIGETLSLLKPLWLPGMQKTNPIVVAKEDKEIKKCIEMKKPGVYNVSLLLPLYLNSSEDISFSLQAVNNKDISIPQFDYIQFYEGFLMALDSIDFKNSKINLNVYDVYNEKQITALIQKGLLDVDLIIGPFLKEPLLELDNYVKEKNIPVVQLYIPEEVGFTLHNKNVISAYPSITQQQKTLLQFLKKQVTSKSRIIVIYQNNTRENQLIDNLRLLVNQFSMDYVIFYDYSTGGLNGVISMLSKESENFIINHSMNEVFLNNFLRNLSNDASDYPITIFGLPVWLRFESIDLSYLNRFNTNFYSSQFINYNDENVIKFIKSFQDTFNTDPGKLAYLGNDIAKYFLPALCKYGKTFRYCLPENSKNMMSFGFKYSLNTDSLLQENEHVFIYKIKDFSLENCFSE